MALKKKAGINALEHRRPDGEEPATYRAWFFGGSFAFRRAQRLEFRQTGFREATDSPQTAEGNTTRSFGVQPLSANTLV
jgi:hypothetical protein